MNVPPFRVRLCHVAYPFVNVTKIPCDNEAQARQTAQHFRVGSVSDNARLSQVDIDKRGDHDVWHLISRRVK